MLSEKTSHDSNSSALERRVKMGLDHEAGNTESKEVDINEFLVDDPESEADEE